MIIDKIGWAAMLEQTAEEAVEVAHACLKYARYLRGENKVHGKTIEQIDDALHEEIADLYFCFDELEDGKILNHGKMKEWKNRKIERCKRRLQEDNHEGI